MLMVADVGLGGVENQKKSADVIYGRFLWGCISNCCSLVAVVK